MQSVAIATTGENVSFAAEVRYPGPPTGWLTIAPASGTTPASLTLLADASRLSAGTYLAQVAITAGRIGSIVNVIFTVGAVPGTTSLVPSRSSLTFITMTGSEILPEQSLLVKTPTGASAEFDVSASSTGNWLTVSPTTATAPAMLSVGATLGALSAGTHTGTIAITPKGGGTSTVIPVVLSVRTSTAAPVLTVSQTSLAFNHQIGTSPALQSVGVSSSVSSLPYTATTSTSWLRLEALSSTAPGSSISDQTPDVFDVLIEPAGLATGTYIGSITVAAPGVPPHLIPVSLTVTSAPSLNADSSSLVFELTPGSGPAGDVLTISSTNGESLSFSVSASPAQPWLTVTPSSGTTEGGIELLGATVDPTGLAPGRYTTTIRLTLQGSTEPVLHIPLALNVTGQSEVPALQVAMEPIELTALIGGPNPTRIVDIRTSIAGTTPEFTAAGISAEGWLSVTPYTGRVPRQITIIADASAVRTAGTYEGSVLLTSLETGAQTTIPVRFTLALQAIVADPSALTFEQRERGTTPPAQSIRLDANSPSTFTVAVRESWLRVEPMQGSTPTTLTVSVNPAVASPGSNTGTIRITGPWNELAIPVTFTVLEPLGPTAAPTSLTFDYELGRSAPPAQSISVGSTGGPVGFTANATTDSGGNWLVVTPTAGTAPTTLAASINTATLVPGRHTGKVTIGSADPTVPARTVSVTLNVTSSGVSVLGLLHAATFAPTAIAPGQIVTITGTGMGPATGVSARPTAAGAIESRLADTRVLFDGVPAPLLYVRSDQINAIVPYSMHGRLSARVQVEAGTSLSLPIEAKVVDVAPGLFTTNSNGRGQAAATNADLTVNSAANPAPRGSIVSVYGTGEGQTDPPGQDGRIILTDLRRPLLTATATVGGRPAVLTYIGSAPTSVSGVFQANVRIPDETEPGAATIQIQIGGSTTQSGVTVAVR
jgi:uncharacterized protein (TIGR03437 family)